MQIIGHTTPQGEHIVVDVHVPLSIHWSGDVDEPPLYWRTGDFTRSLLEIGCDRRTGSICRATLVMADDVRHSTVLPVISSIPVKHGVPCCDVAAWHRDPAREFGERFADNFIDQPMSLTVELTATALVVSLGDGDTTATVYSTGRVQFGVAGDSTLRWIRLGSLQSTEHAVLREAFDSGPR